MGLINSFPGGNGGGDFDFENYQPTFTEASTRANIASGEKNSVILGKIKKFFTDLKAVAFSGNASDITPDSTHRFVTDTEKSTWNGKQNAITAGANLAFTGNTLDASYPVMGVVSKSDLYDTTEKVVGKWTDGRPVYQKTVNFGALPNTTSKSVAHSISNLGIVISSVAFTNDGTNYVPIPATSTNSFSNQVSLTINKTNISIATSSNLSSYSCYVTLQYTKTTDAANSFKYADENDYSTTEHIVGTWIDGKPVYQKTIDCGSLPNNTAKDVAHGISNIKKVVKISGAAYTSSGTVIAISLPNASTASATVEIKFVGENINIKTIQDMHGFDVSYITLQYTKTTD